jgi:hypothetical protein
MPQARGHGANRSQIVTGSSQLFDIRQESNPM